MNVDWADMQTGLFEVLLDGRFFEAGAVVEASTEGGFIHYIPADPETGALLYSQSGEGWIIRTMQGRVSILRWPPGGVPH